MIKLIIFDFWSTIGYKKYKKGNLISLWKKIGKKYEFRKFDKAYERNFQLDKSPNYESKYKKLLKEFKIPYTDELIKKYADYRRRLDSKRYLYSFVIPLFKKLKQKGYKISVLSNTTYAHGSKIKKMKLKKYVDKFFFSYEIGSIKPDLRNFKYILSYFKIKPSEALMIGNSYKDDVVPARKLGMKAIHFQGCSKLRKDLRQMEVI